MGEPITVEALRGSPTKLLFHARIQGGGLWCWQSTVEPRITITVRNVVRRGVRSSDRTMCVDGVPVADLDEAAARLNAGPAPAEPASDGSAPQ